MTNIEIIDFITFYGVDVAVLGIITSVLTQLLKTTLLKNAPNKLYAFLPVIIGTALYAMFSLLSHGLVCGDFGIVLEKGFSVGAAATVVYVIYEQFARGKLKLPAEENVDDEDISDSADEGKLNTDEEKLNTSTQNSEKSDYKNTCAD